jgi:regulator of sigma E protease
MSSNFLTSIAVVVVVLGVMILVHELGHFIAAKLFGVRVLTFSIGFGKRLFGFKYGPTDYRVSLLPLGGYVKMAGDDPSEVREGDPDEFLAKPRWQRFIIAVMGPSMNVLMAILLLAGLYRFHFPKPAFMEQPVLVGDVAPDSPAARAGIQAGDLIVRLGDLQKPDWEEFRMKVMMRAGEALPVEVVRGGEKISMTLTPQATGPDEVGDSGLAPCVPGEIGSQELIAPGKPADQAGLKTGDKFIEVNGQSVACWQQVVSLIQQRKGKAVDATVLRDGKPVQLSITPYWGDSGNGDRWLIGISFPTTPRDIVVRQLPWGQAFATSLDDNIRDCILTFDVLGRILTRHMSARSLSGPIGIAQISGRAYREGLPSLLMLVSFISLQLGIFNLLPIPILDGGMILMLLIETVMRRDLSLAVKERFAQIGIVFLLLLAVFVTYNDIIKTLRP